MSSLCIKNRKKNSIHDFTDAVGPFWLGWIMSILFWCVLAMFARKHHLTGGDELKLTASLQFKRSGLII